ncbi:hypothetical protein MMC11_006969 [Xylographa trunciseda]|nr:hypothetical protein [Xylographa trunciseda]
MRDQYSTGINASSTGPTAQSSIALPASRVRGQNLTQTYLPAHTNSTGQTSHDSRASPELPSSQGQGMPATSVPANLSDVASRSDGGTIGIDEVPSVIPRIEELLSVQGRQTRVSGKNKEETRPGHAVLTPPSTVYTSVLLDEGYSIGTVIPRRSRHEVLAEGSRNVLAKRPLGNPPFPLNLMSRNSDSKASFEMPNPLPVVQKQSGSIKRSNSPVSEIYMKQSPEQLATQSSPILANKSTTILPSDKPSFTAKPVDLPAEGGNVLRSAGLYEALSGNDWNATLFEVRRKWYEKLQRYWSIWSRPSIRPGYQRIEWICDCGQLLYGDFDPNDQEGLSNLAFRLHNPRQNDAEETTHQESVDSIATSSPDPGQNNGQVQKSARQTRRSRLSKEAPSIISVACTQGLPAEPRVPKFVEVCVNTGKWQKSLGEIDITNVNCDRDLFAMIKQRYDDIRAHRAKLFFLEPARVAWVQFSLEERHRVGIMLQPMAVPPKHEVDNRDYDYTPCPLGALPPIPDNVFMHHLIDPGPHRRPLWLKRIPKKLNHSLLTSSDELVIGWGLHIIEGPNWVAVWIAGFCIIFLSCALSLLWAIFRSDVSGGFGMGAWLVSLSTLGMMAFFSKWSQQ